MKNKFVGLIQVQLDFEGEEVQLNEKVLEENALNGRTFWTVLCPFLKREGLLKKYSDPDGALSEFQIFVFSHPELRVITGKAVLSTSGYSDAEWVKISEITTKLRRVYNHRFVVDRNKLLEWKDDELEPKKTNIYVDRKRGLYTEQGDKRILYRGLRPTDKIFKTIIFMMKGGVFNIKELCDHTYQKSGVVKNSIKRLNENFPRVFGINQIPICLDNGAYELNRKFYNFI